jgi:alkylated DNA repair dioxygenase AlkB
MDICQIFKEYTGANLINDINRNKVNYNQNNYLSYLQYISLYCVKHNVGNVELAHKILKTLEQAIAEPFKGTVTLTFGDVAESHVGMQQIGEMAQTGFSYEDLLHAQEYFKSQGCEVFIIRLNDWLPKKVDTNERENLELNKANTDENFQAYLLVARDGLKCLGTDPNNLLSEVLMFDWDTKVWNKKQKKVQNKQARYNINFSDEHQVADFQEGKGTTIAWGEVPLLQNVKTDLVKAFGEKAEVLKCEGNLYYEKGNTGIGYHGDSERRRVIGVRLGGSMTIHYNWFYNSRPRGKNVSLTLNNGDVYCMSEKTVGTDWMLAPKHQYTLRHAAGAENYTTKTQTLRIVNKKESQINNNVVEGSVQFKPKKSQSNPNPTWNDCDEIQEY